MIVDSGAISFQAVLSHCQVVIIQVLYVLLQLSLDSWESCLAMYRWHLI